MGTRQTHYIGEGFRWFFIYALIIVACVVGSVFFSRAEAQTVTAEADVTWTLPTKDLLGQPLTGDRALTKVQLFVSTSPITANTTLTPIELPAGATTYTYEQTVQNGSTLYFRVKACNALCSGFSNEDSKEVRVSVPDVPTGVTVTLRVNLEVQQP